MADEEKVATPEEGTTVTEPTQPQVDPDVTPEGTIQPDDQQRTTGKEPSEKEKHIQTKYQGLVKALKDAGVDPDLVVSGEEPPGTLDAAFGDQQVPEQEPAQEQEPEAEDFDPYDPVQMKGYLDQKLGGIRGDLKKTVSDVIREVRQDEQRVAKFESEKSKFNDWAVENKVPQKAINAAVKQYYADFGMAGTPKAFVKTVKNYIKQGSSVQGMTDKQQAAVKDALEKAAALDKVENPKPGAAPSPKSQEEKTRQQKEADDIVQDQEYVPPE